MIKIQFSPLSNQDSSYKNVFFNELDNYLVPTNKDITPVTADFNGENYNVQHITYDSFKCSFYLRYSEYIRFQNIQSAKKINVWEIGEEKRFDGEEFEIIEFESDIFNDTEFYECIITFRQLNTKLIENVILNTIQDYLYIGELGFNAGINLDQKSNIDFVTTLVDEFKDRVIDYNKISIYVQLRFYLEYSDLVEFITELSDVCIDGDTIITYKSISYKQYTFEKKEIGNNLFQIDLNLYPGNEIVVPGT